MSSKPKKKKPEKLEPVIILSREGMMAVGSQLVADRIALDKLRLKIAAVQLRVERKHQPEVDDLQRRIAMAEGGLHVWAKQHEATEFDGRRSIDLPSFRLGFRDGPPKVEKAGSETWEKIVARLAAVYLVEPPAIEGGEPTVLFNGANYLRYAPPTVDKEGLIRDRADIPDAAWAAAGIHIEKDEFFFFEPKSEVLEPSTQVAA